MTSCKAKIPLNPAPVEDVSEAPARGAPLRILRLTQVIDMTGLRKTKIYELQAQGRFPLRVQITSHSVGWVEHEVVAWVNGRMADRKSFHSVVPRISPSRN
jgi:prophage regulatory protein